MRKVRRHFRRVVGLVTTGVCLGLIIVLYLQQQHFANYLPRHTKIGSIQLNGQVKRTDVAQMLAAETAKQHLRLQLLDKTIEYPLAETGTSYDIGAAARQVNDQANHFFALDLIKKPAPIVLPVQVDDAKLAAFAQKIASEQSSQLVRAKFSLAGATIQVHPGKGATQYDAAQMAAAIRAGVIAGATTVRISPRTSAAPNTPAQLAATQAALQSMINAPATIAVGGRSFTSTPAQRFDWITIEELPAGDFRLTVDPVKVTAHAKTVASALYLAPVTTTVTLLDDAEIARSTGAAGASLAVDTVAAQVRSRLETGNRQAVTAALTPIAPAVHYARTYSRSATGLSLLLRDFAAERHATFGLVMDDLSGPLDASYNAGTSFVTASVFKAFLAYAVLKKVDTGEYTMATLTPGGNTVQAAIDKMIHVSDNQVAYELHQLYGFANIDPFLHSQGFDSTILNNYDANGRLISNKTTIPRDTANLLTRLQSGTLLASATRDYLLTLMQNQIFRQGIPKGSTPSPVADKVGYLGSYVHDAGIIYSPRGTYVLVVLTKGGTWADITELARRVYQLYGS